MKKFIHQYNRKIWLLFIITFVIAVSSLAFLPQQLPIHFNVQGEPDNFAGKWSIFLAPAIILLFIFLAEILRDYDPKSKNYIKFETYYYGIHFAVSLLMLFIQVYTIAFVLGWQVNISRLMPPAIGLLLLFLGNIMPKFKHNYFVGVRTSWTLASERVWYLTHRFAGKIFVISGLLFILTGFLPFKYTTWLIVLIIALLIFLPVTASFYYYRKYEFNA